MKKADEMLREYDLKNLKGTRGKYSKAYDAGHSVRIFKGTKQVSDQFFAAIESDLREYFPDSKSINKTLRTLIKLTGQNSKTQKSG